MPLFRNYISLENFATLFVGGDVLDAPPQNNVTLFFHTEKPMTKFLIIRHGESETNLTGVFTGQSNAPLTERGILQAKCTAEFIKNNYKVDKVITSDLARAFVTGKAVADHFGLDVTPTPELREISAGKWEAVPFSDIKEAYPELYASWFGDIGVCRCPGGESVTELGDRVFRCFTRIAEENPDSTVVIATHATPIRALQSIITYGSVNGMKHINWVSNASLSTVICDNGKWEFVEASRDEHLKDLVTDALSQVK